eukprot:1254114-Rhodomonas_salina.1
MLPEDALEGSDLPFDARLDGLPRVTAAVVTSISLSSFRTEDFDLTRQGQLVDSLSVRIGLIASEVQVSGLEDSGEASFPLAVQLVLLPSRPEVNLSALPGLVWAVVDSGNLSSALASQGMGSIVAQLIKVQLERSFILEEPLPDTDLPNDVPHVLTKLRVTGET